MNRTVHHIRQLKAFTIMELLIVMLISGIAMSLVYGVYQNSTRMFKAKTEHSRDYAELLALHSCFKNEFASSRAIHTTEHSLVISLPGNKITYDLAHDAYIIRYQVRPDTFFIPHGMLKAIAGNELNDAAADGEQKPLIQSIELPVFYRSDTLRLYYHRGISINEWLSYEND